MVHRLGLMSNFIMAKAELQLIEARVLLVASERDRLLPSVQEANRLAQHIRRAMVKVVPEAGHAVLLEEQTRLIVRFSLPPNETTPPRCFAALGPRPAPPAALASRLRRRARARVCLRRTFSLRPGCSQRA